MTSRAGRRKLLSRLMALVEGQVAQIEIKREEEPVMSADEMRLLDAMTKTLERVIALSASENKTATTPKRRVQKVDPELEAIRQRLVQRIEKLETE